VAKELNIIVDYSSEQFTQDFIRNLKQNCKDYIPRAQTLYIIEESIDGALGGYTTEIAYKENTSEYGLKFQALSGSTENFEFSKTDLIGRASTAYRAKVDITDNGVTVFSRVLQFYVILA
jgi:hypothetical protein